MVAAHLHRAESPRARGGRARALATLAGVAIALWLAPLHVALADVAPAPRESLIGPMLLLFDLFAYLPFTGLYLLAYFLVVLRKNRIRGMPALAVGHVIVGLVVTSQSFNLGLMQIIGGVVLFVIDTLVGRAVHRRRRQMMASQSGFSMPSMAPITTTASRHNLPVQTDSSESNH